MSYEVTHEVMTRYELYVSYADIGSDARKPPGSDTLARPPRAPPDSEPRAPRYSPRGRRDLRDHRGAIS